MKKLFLLPLAACLLVACPGTDKGGEGGGGGSGKVDPVTFNYDAISAKMEEQLTTEKSSTYLVNAAEYEVGGLKFAAAGNKVFGRFSSYEGNEGYQADKVFQIKKAGGDVLTVTGLKGFKTITVVSITTYTDSTIDKLAGIKANDEAVATEDTIATVATGHANKGTGDKAGQEFPTYSITLTYKISADTTTFSVVAPTGNAAYVQSITIA